MTSNTLWDQARWDREAQQTARRALRAPDEAGTRRVLTRACRRVMRTFTTSFFIVSRFLPRTKRDGVEAIYAAVRYPDEVVDTFPLPPADKLALLDAWAAAYEQALDAPSCREALEQGLPPFLTGFARLVCEAGIPPEHYRAFLDAMRVDAAPRPFATLDDLIDGYIYGSAIVVGYFLTHVYGSRTPEDLPRALASARALGIGLQLTNFLRDVGEDQRRGRCYLPRDWLRREGLQAVDAADPAQRAALERVIGSLAETAEGYYRQAAADLDAFAPDCRVAIKACIDVYGLLNRRILENPSISRRESVPMREKLAPLPPSKIWRIPAAYLVP